MTKQGLSTCISTEKMNLFLIPVRIMDIFLICQYVGNVINMETLSAIGI